jgi:hypothetical protein
MSNQNKKNESKAPDEKLAENKNIDGLKNESKVPDGKVAENKNIDDMKNGSIALQKETHAFVYLLETQVDFYTSVLRYVLLVDHQSPPLLISL